MVVFLKEPTDFRFVDFNVKKNKQKTQEAPIPLEANIHPW